MSRAQSPDSGDSLPTADGLPRAGPGGSAWRSRDIPEATVTPRDDNQAGDGLDLGLALRGNGPPRSASLGARKPLQAPPWREGTMATWEGTSTSMLREGTMATWEDTNASTTIGTLPRPDLLQTSGPVRSGSNETHQLVLGMVKELKSLGMTVSEQKRAYANLEARFTDLEVEHNTLKAGLLEAASLSQAAHERPVDSVELKKSKSAYQSKHGSIDEPFKSVTKDLEERKTTYTSPHGHVEERLSVRVSRMSQLMIPGMDGDWSHKTFKLQASMWDAAFFIGSPSMGSGASVALMICLFVNVSMAALFILLCLTNLGDPTYDENTLSDFKIWRSTVAHDISYRNPLTDESLASGVCTTKLYLPFSTGQVTEVQNLQDYLTAMGPYTTGSLMCVLSLGVWTFTVIHDLRTVSFVASATWRMPHDSQCRMLIETVDGLRLGGVSRFRRCYMMTILLVHTIQCVVLFWSGYYFLIYTVEVTELLLNAVALELILKLDELIFETLAPTHAQMLIENLLPIRMPPSSKHWNSFGDSIILILVAGTVVECGRRLEVFPFVATLRDNLDALCGGESTSRDFVMTIDSLGLPWATATPAAADAPPPTYATWVVAEVKENGFPKQDLQPGQRSNLGIVMQAASPRDLLIWQRDAGFFGFAKNWGDIDLSKFQFVVGWNELVVRRDQDFGDGEDTVYSKYLQYVLKAPTTKNLCASAPDEMCYLQGSTVEKTRLRQLCPSRCGCNTPRSGTAANPTARSALRGWMGCSPWNMETFTFQSELANTPCADTTDRETFANWTRGLGDHTMPAPNDTRVSTITDVMKAYDEGGCYKAVYVETSQPLSNICIETSVASMCPASCGCNASLAWHGATSPLSNFCPLPCGKQAPMCFTKPIIDDHGYTGYVEATYESKYPCVFPFIYAGKRYDKCTWADWFAPWCAVINDAGGVSSKWGECGTNCPL